MNIKQIILKINKAVGITAEDFGNVNNNKNYNNKNHNNQATKTFKYLSISLISIMLVASVVSIVLANSPATVTDNFTDSSKIATSANVTVANGVISLTPTSTWTCGSNIVDSRDSKIYTTVFIGTQCWMKENMNIGTKITSCTNGYAGVCTTGGDTVKDQGTDCSSAVVIEKYCYSDSEANCTTYGGFYQWGQAMCGSTTEGAQGICPTGWHIPTDAEQYTLENFLKDSGQTCNASRSGAYDCATAGTKLKSGGTSGFNGLLAGYRSIGGSFGDLSSYTGFWSSLQSDTSAWSRYLGSGGITVNRYLSSKVYGFSVRCLKN